MLPECTEGVRAVNLHSVAYSNAGSDHLVEDVFADMGVDDNVVLNLYIKCNVVIHCHYLLFQIFL